MLSTRILPSRSNLLWKFDVLFPSEGDSGPAQKGPDRSLLSDTDACDHSPLYREAGGPAFSDPICKLALAWLYRHIDGFEMAC